MRLIKVEYEDFHELMKPRKGQKCWICKKVELVPKQNCYEIVLGIVHGYSKVVRKKILVCENCLCQIPDLADCQVLSFGDGKHLPSYVADGPGTYGSTPEPEFRWSDVISQHFK